MADGKKYKLGDMEFETEQEYRQAAADLKRIRELMAKYNVSDPEQAGKILAIIRKHPETFRSPYGKKFIERLERSAAKAVSAPAQNAPADRTLQMEENTDNRGAADFKNLSQGGIKEEPGKQKRKKEKRRKRDAAPQDKQAGKEKFQIFTVRNFAIGIIIIACVVVLSIFAPQIFSFQKGGNSNSDIKRTMVTAYAKNQADLKAQLYTYYFNVVGETEEEASKDADAGIASYVMDLSDRTISRMTDSEIEEIYGQLTEGGDIQNNSFVEPSDITVLKDKLLAAGLSGNGGNGVEGETAVVAAINSMMDYQERMYYALYHSYSLLNYQKDDCRAFATEDITAMFGDVIYDVNMTEDEKQSYFDAFVKRGLIKDNQIVRFSTDPTAYHLPDLTPKIEVSMHGKDAKAYECSMITYAPAASVFYQIHGKKKNGYLCFRNNGKNTEYIQLDEDTSVTAQGDFYLFDGTDFYTGQWFYNKQDIGLLINGDQSSLISYVHDLTY